MRPHLWRGQRCGLAANGKRGLSQDFRRRSAPPGTWELIGVALWLPFVFTIRGIAGYLNTYLIQYTGVRVLEGRCVWNISQSSSALPLSFFSRRSSGDLIARGLGDTTSYKTR